MKLKTKDFIFVGIQFLLFLIYVFEIKLLSFSLPDFLNIVFLIVSIIGFLIVIVALLQLNKNLSPFPTPKSNSELIQTGLYKYIRHPIYTGIILMTFSYGLYSNSSFKLIISILLLILFYFKSSYEEKMLQNKFSEYSEYKKTVGRFFPKF
jgi:protein-S-isoprenylcysteine O-methyltransferase Ste14